MGPRMREDTGHPQSVTGDVPHGSPHARGHGRGTRGMGSCSHVHEGRLFVGKTGGADAGVRNDIWEKGMALEGEGGFEPAPTYC